MKESNKNKKRIWNFRRSEFKDGNMSYSHGEKDKVSKNINKFLTKENVPSQKRIVLVPSHLNGVIEISENKRIPFEKLTKDNETNEYYVHADAFVSNIEDYTLCLKPADCAAILISNKDSNWYGFLHVGMVNLLNNVITKTMDLLNTKGKDWQAVIVTHIHKKSYKHDKPELYDILMENGFEDIIEQKEDGYYFDLSKGIKNELYANGVKPAIMEQVDNFDLALKKESFSHRAFKLGLQEEDGRFIWCAWKS